RAGRCRTARRRLRHDLLLPHRAPRSARLRRALDFALHDDPRVPRPFLPGEPPRRRDRRDLLALRGRNVDRGVHHRLHHLMINPLRSEAEAFRFLIGTIVYFAAITIAAVAGGKWVGLGVFIFLTAVALGWWARTRRTERPVQTVPRPSAEGERRILVVANETVGGGTLRDLIHERSEGVREEVLVVTPALNPPIRH